MRDRWIIWPVVLLWILLATFALATIVQSVWGLESSETPPWYHLQDVYDDSVSSGVSYCPYYSEEYNAISVVEIFAKYQEKTYWVAASDFYWIVFEKDGAAWIGTTNEIPPFVMATTERFADMMGFYKKYPDICDWLSPKPELTT